MDFIQLVRNILFESPDGLNYRGTDLSFQQEQGSPHTFFITQASIRIDARKGTKADIDSPFGICVIYGPSSTNSAPEDSVRINYYEDTDTRELTHANLASLLIYNNQYSYQDFKKFGIGIFSSKKDVDTYFDQFKKAYPKITFTLTKDQEEIGLEYRGRFWFINGKAIVSLWHFNKDVCMKYLIPFFKNKYGLDEDNVVFEVASFEENESKEQGTDKYVSGSELKGKTIEQKPYERKLNELLAKIHTASGPDKEKVRQQLKELLKKHGLDPKRYGISDEVLKSSEITAQRMLAGTKPKETMAALRAKTRTSESFKLFFTEKK